MAVTSTREDDWKHDAESVASFFKSLRVLALEVDDRMMWRTLETLQVETFMSHHVVHLAVTKHLNMFISMEKAVYGMQRRRPQLNCVSLIHMIWNLRRVLDEIDGSEVQSEFKRNGLIFVEHK